MAILQRSRLLRTYLVNLLVKYLTSERWKYVSQIDLFSAGEQLSNSQDNRLHMADWFSDGIIIIIMISELTEFICTVNPLYIQDKEDKGLKMGEQIYKITAFRV